MRAVKIVYYYDNRYAQLPMCGAERRKINTNSLHYVMPLVVRNEKSCTLLISTLDYIHKKSFSPSCFGKEAIHIKPPAHKT